MLVKISFFVFTLIVQNKQKNIQNPYEVIYYKYMTLKLNHALGRCVVKKYYKDFWYRLAIKRKLLTFFLIIAFFGVIINVYLHNNNYSVMESFNENLTNYYEINELQILINDNQQYVLDYLRTANEISKKDYIETQKIINEQIKRLENTFTKGEQYFILNAIKYSFQAYSVKWDEAVEGKINDNNNHYVSYYEGTHIYTYTEQYLQDLLNESINQGAILYNDLAQNSKFNRMLSIIIIVITFILSLVFGGIFSKYLVAPIKKLAEASSDITNGNLDIDIVEVTSKDEIGVLAESFNAMSESIKRLVDDLNEKAFIEKELHKETVEKIKMKHLLQEAEFLALQSQINPHFLFNTLNTISRTAMFEKANETTKLINSLAAIFRFSLRKGGKIISLKEEVNMLEEYIYLQKFRFKERLEFEIICNINVEDVEVPYFIIQPLVENSIIHGIEPKIEGGKIRLKIIRVENNVIIIKVIDTGVGIPKDKLRYLFNQKDSKSIGINNVKARLENYYDNKSKFKIQSKEGMGTVITIRIPCKSRGENDV
jgi:sensor histidine kinase YesM